MRVMSEVSAERVEAAGGRGRAAAGAGAGAGPLWSLFSWLRRDEQSASSDSLSSAGSDRTAVSFAFLAPPPQRAPVSAAPSPRPPATDSYRKRVRDRHLQRQQDRDLTLHRKYGLYYGYDALSLPPAHTKFGITEEKRERDRRATSESLPRRVSHVPGKRRAPQPPTRPHSVALSASIARRYKRKRPAPPPPNDSSDKAKENIPIELNNSIERMFSKPDTELKSSETNNPNDSKPEKYKKDNNSKDIKLRTEKSFLKLIFENRKRNSVIEPAPERILPSISELDKQAAEIIELCKLKPLEQNNNISETSLSQGQTWYCTRCLRKYDSTIVTCQHCLPEQKRLSTIRSDSMPSTSCYTQTEKESASKVVINNRASIIDDNEKQKLKEMLKEMKDSLPKKTKQENSGKQSKTKEIYKFEGKNIENSSRETPTLRIGSVVEKEKKLEIEPSTSTTVTVPTTKVNDLINIEQILPRIKTESSTQNVVITKHVVLVAPQSENKCAKIIESNNNKPESVSTVLNPSKSLQVNSNITNNVQSTTANTDANKLHIPLRISSLLNPVYIPKQFSSEQTNHSEEKTVEPATPVKKSIATQRATNVATPSTSVQQPMLKLTQPLAKQSNSQTKNGLLENFGNHAEKPITEKLQPIQPTSQMKSNPTITGFEAPTSSRSPPDKTNLRQSNMIRFNVEQHSRRRELINQLEQSIAKGDERSAAEAATKLAQLRLSCSVLSFNSHIISDEVKPVTKHEQEQSVQGKIIENTKDQTPITKLPMKIDAAVQLSALTSNKSKVYNIIDAKPSTSSASQIMENSTASLIKNKRDDVTRLKTDSKENKSSIQIWVEDREATRGPVSLRIGQNACMGELRHQAEISLGVAGVLQRWIIGRTLCTDDATPLVSLAGHDLSAPFYLCVVETDKKSNKTEVPTGSKTSNDTRTNDVYTELMQLEKRAIVYNAEKFECTICMEECAVGSGAVLRECVHTFCKECLSDLIRHSEEPVVSCPAMGCPGFLQEREIRALVTNEEYERWLARSLVAAESGTRNAFHCRTRDCIGWAFCDPDVRRFPCPVCKHNNCIPCQAIHEGETCDEHRLKLEAVSNSNQTDEGTQTLLNSLIAKGEALECPECSAIITKKWGCDWVKCTACKTEICWVTRGPRWGSGGKGDTSGGCRCGVDGKRCHPSCGYCH